MGLQGLSTIVMLGVEVDGVDHYVDVRSCDCEAEYSYAGACKAYLDMEEEESLRGWGNGSILRKIDFHAFRETLGR